MSPKTRFFTPPADLNDFGDELRDLWHRHMSGWFNDEIRRVAKNLPKDGCQFYNPSTVGNSSQEIAVPITWRGFPKGLLTLYDEDVAYAKAEVLATFGEKDAAGVTREPFRDPDGNDLMLQYRMQDEYLEWRAERDPTTGKVLRVTFTCEGPEYWQVLAKYDRPKLLDLYHAFVDPAVTWDDLIFQTDAVGGMNDGSFQAGDYNPRNVWNTTRGIMHLTHWANTLGAEIGLAGDATILRPGVGGEEFLKEPVRLMSCSGMGNPNRSSDPQIGSSVNSLARLGAYVSLQIPVGLYIDQVAPNVVTDERGNPVPDLFRVLRGNAGVPGHPDHPSHIVRLEFCAPAGRNYVLGDLFVDGKPIVTGGQLATHIHMKLVATYFDVGHFHNDPVQCDHMGWRLAAKRDFLENASIGDGAPEEGFEPAFSRCKAGTSLPTPDSPGRGRAHRTRQFRTKRHPS